MRLRVGARLLDTALFGLIMTPALIEVVIQGRIGEGTYSALPLGLGLIVLQWVLLGALGQTVGKRVLRLRIVDVSGDRAGFWRIVVLRGWLMHGAILASLMVLLGWAGWSAVFWVGLVGLAGLPMWGTPQPFLADRVTGTVVVQQP